MVSGLLRGDILCRLLGNYYPTVKNPLLRPLLLILQDTTSTVQSRILWLRELVISFLLILLAVQLFLSVS